MRLAGALRERRYDYLVFTRRAALALLDGHVVAFPAPAGAQTATHGYRSGCRRLELVAIALS